jgi:hypothetical protein
MHHSSSFEPSILAGGRTTQSPTLTASGGDCIGPYFVLGLLGRGGLGLVLRVTRGPGHPELALKILRAGDAATPAERRTLQRELEASRRLFHPNLVPILDSGESEGRPWLVMPLMHGGSLSARLDQGNLPPHEAVRIVLAAARGVAHAHELGILHRDLKPANILLDENGEPHVTDFGLARFADAHTRYTMSGQLLGSVPYMAPEQASGHSHEATPATDVWAFGVILYELITGKRPFEGSTAEILDRVREVRYSPASSVEPTIPRPLDAIIRRCLQRSPQRRYANARELANDLERWLSGSPVSAVMAEPVATRWSASVGLGLLLILVMLAGGLLVHSPAVETVSEHPSQRVAPGNKIYLWTPGKGPIAHRFVFGEDISSFSPKRRPGVLGAVSATLMELLPADAQRGPYRLTLRCRQVVGGELTDIGLYCGYSSHGPADKQIHRFMQMTYQEPGHFMQSKNDQVVIASLHPRMLIERPGMKPLPIGGAGLPLKRPPVQGFRRNDPPVRLLELEVYPDRWVARFDGVAGKFTHKEAADSIHFYTEIQNLRGLPPVDLGPTQPAGLIVWGSTMEVYSVKYEPLATQP